MLRYLWKKLTGVGVRYVVVIDPTQTDARFPANAGDKVRAKYFTTILLEEEDKTETKIKYTLQLEIGIGVGSS